MNKLGRLKKVLRTAGARDQVADLMWVDAMGL